VLTEDQLQVAEPAAAVGVGRRVLLVAHALPPHLGGIEVIVEQEAEALSRFGADVTVLTSSWGSTKGPPASATAASWAAWERRTVPALNLLEDRFGVPFPLFGPSLLTAAVRAVQRVDVVHVHDVFYLSSLAAALAARAWHKPLVLSQHVDLIPHSSRLVVAAQKAVFRTYGRLLFSQASRLFVVNDRVADFVAAAGAHAERIEFLPTGVDTAAFRPPHDGEAVRIRRDLGLPEDRVLVLFAGRFVPKKNFGLLAACAHPDYDLVFVGGDRRPTETAANGGRRHFLGSVPREQMGEMYRAVDVFCLPSCGEGFPLTVQEAMASGLPVVTSDDDAYRRYALPPSTIAFVAPRQADLTAALLRLARDRTTMDSMGRNAGAYAREHFSWDKHARRLLEVYREVQG
jgi:D-inositol-3-phosphate glycosyltransferase